MRSETSLRRQIVRACVLLAAGLCCVFALLFLLGVGVVEDRLLNDRMVAAADGFIDSHVYGARKPMASDPQVYQDGAIPAEMRALSPGLHELSLDHKELHVLIRDLGGHRFALVEDESGFESVESQIRTALALTFALCIALAFLLGASTARRVTRPLVELARAVQQDVWTEALPGQARADEVGILARALAAHDQEMKRFLTREQLFTGDVSHELRTPLTVMLGAAEVLTARLEGQAELLPVAERIRRTAQETANRVAALLLLSRAPDELERPLVALGPLLEQELERCRPLVEGKPVRLELRIEHPALAHGRPELMAIAFGNLIRNACQSTEAGHVRVTLQRQQVLVEDSGCGVAEEVRHQLFHRLVRAGDRVPGTGLGLAIVQRVCEHLGWTVSLNESGAGVTSFAVRTHAGSV